MAAPDEANDLMTTEQAAKLMCAKPGMLRNWRSMHKGPPWAKVGRRVVYRRRDIEAYIDECFHMTERGA